MTTQPRSRGRAGTSVLAAFTMAMAALVASVPTRPAQAQTAGIRAGVGVVDATWFVGAAAGQYGTTANGEVLSPGQFSTLKVPSWGIQSRLSIRAIVVEGNNGERVALVKSDNYLAQDYLSRRVGQLLDAAGSQVGYEGIVHAASHNHSSPYYATPSAGVWLFQDVFDLRFFEYQARAMADAILEAEANLVPARVGATVVEHELYKGNIMRAQAAFDGSPTGFPNDWGDKELIVLRFDDLSDPEDPQPLATWMNWGQHPESLDSYDLISADFLGPLERFVDEATGAPLVFSQGDVGSAEGPYDGWNRGRMSDGTLIAWAHVGYAQTERGARLLADDVIAAFEHIGATGGDLGWLNDFEVGIINGWVPGPLSHPYPSAAACSTDRTLVGDPGVLFPAGCERGDFDTIDPLVQANLALHEVGVPIPSNYTLPAGGAAEENFRIHLQAVKLGPILLASCSCEAQVDLILNLKSRANDVVGDQYDGWDWLTDDPHTDCSEADGSWSCVYDHPGVGGREWSFDQAAFAKWQAQVHNPADGWDALDNILFANEDPADPADVYGNFSTEELDSDTGFPLVVGLGHTGDYNGYTVSYREYIAYDHYRKALTSYGPHTADWMVTWLVRMARSLNDPSYDWEATLAAVDPTAPARGDADEARQVALAETLGAASGPAYELWQQTLPSDLGPIEILEQPESIRRFDGTLVTWRGGSNAVDQPAARVERLVNGSWEPWADMTGEVQVTLDLPEGVLGAAEASIGPVEWIWHANVEAFTGGPNSDLENTPPGTYRFVIDGQSRVSGATEPYHLESDPFAIDVWDGIDPGRLSFDPDTRTAALTTDPVVYPRTYESSVPFIGDDGRGLPDPETGEDTLTVCETCSFRPWAFEGEVASVELTIRRPDGSAEARTMARVDDGRFEVVLEDVEPGDIIEVTPGDILDQAGNTNSQASNAIELGDDLSPVRSPLPATGGGIVLAMLALLGLTAIGQRRRA
ncbi:MAG: neutral/alkaline non-lysosomal ceramidase N-terminal domain-containing protein [Nitriliruptorales bacterium]|nr:neutral/alkaline non-lysosomal ceramidase N-terminal domain-containing protein [Nitriliruptorales bacterium]